MDFLCKKSWKILEIFANFLKNIEFYAKFDRFSVKFLQNYALFTKIFRKSWKIYPKAARRTEILHKFSENLHKNVRFLNF